MSEPKRTVEWVVRADAPMPDMRGFVISVHATKRLARAWKVEHRKQWSPLWSNYRIMRRVETVVEEG